MTKSYEHYSKTLGELTASKCKAKAAFTKIKHELIRQLKQTTPNHRETKEIISRLNECQEHAIALMLRLASEYKESDYKQCWRNTVRETEIMKKEFEESRIMAQGYLENTKNGIPGNSSGASTYVERSRSSENKSIEMRREDAHANNTFDYVVDGDDCDMSDDEQQFIEERQHRENNWDVSTFYNAGEDRWMKAAGWKNNTDFFNYRENAPEKRIKDERRRKMSDSTVIEKHERNRRIKERQVPFNPSVIEKSKQERGHQKEDTRRRMSCGERATYERNEREEHRLKNMQRKSDPAYLTHTLEKMIKNKRVHDERYTSLQIDKENALKSCRKENKIQLKANPKSVIRRHVSFGGFDSNTESNRCRVKPRHHLRDCASESLISIVENRKSFINYNKLKEKLLDILEYPKPRRKNVKDVQEMMKAYYKKLCDDILVLSEEYKHDIRRKESEMMDAFNAAQMFLDACEDDRDSESEMSVGDFSLKDLPHKINHGQRKMPTDDELLINVNVRL